MLPEVWYWEKDGMTFLRTYESEDNLQNIILKYVPQSEWNRVQEYLQVSKSSITYVGVRDTYLVLHFSSDRFMRLFR